MSTSVNRRFSFIVIAALVLLNAFMAGCSGGGGSNDSNGSTPRYSIGGTITGLNGSGLVLQNNGADDLTSSASGSFVFSRGIVSGASYSITVKTQATNPFQFCGVTNGSGTVSEADVTNITVDCPVSILASATAFGQTRVDLTWGASGVTAAGYNIYRSAASGTLGTVIATTAGNVGNYRDSGLTQNTAYYYTIKSAPGSGANVQSMQVTATTAWLPTFALYFGKPSPVTGLMATRVGDKVTLSWDNYDYATMVEVYRTVNNQFPLGSQYTMTNLFSSTFINSITDTIAGNGLYSYTVGVYSAYDSSVAAWAQVSIDVPEGTLPGLERPIFDFWPSGIDKSVLHVYWYGSAGAEAYHVYAAPWVGNAAPTIITPSQGGTTAALEDISSPIYEVSPGYYGLDIPLTKLSSGYNAVAIEAVKGTYVAVGGGGNGFPVAAPAPVGVTGVRTTPLNPTSVDISWDAAAGAGSYKVYRVSSPTEAISASNWIGVTSGTTYRNTSLTPSTSYLYRVTATTGSAGSGAESTASDYAEAKTFSDAKPVTLLPIFLPTLGQADLLWFGGNAYGTTFKIYGGGSLIPTDIDSSNFVVQTTLGSNGRSAWNQWVSAPTGAYAAYMLSSGLATCWGHYWIEEIYPDGTASARSEFILFGFM